MKMVDIFLWDCYKIINHLLKGNTYWKGMVENLMDGSAQLASASLTITPARATAMDYLPPLGTEKYQLILKSSNIEDVSWRTYGMQFRVELWSVIFAMVFCFWILILMSEWLLDKTFTLPSPAVSKQSPSPYGLAIIDKGFRNYLEHSGSAWQPILAGNHTNLQMLQVH